MNMFSRSFVFLFCSLFGLHLGQLLRLLPTAAALFLLGLLTSCGGGGKTSSADEYTPSANPTTQKYATTVDVLTLKDIPRLLDANEAAHNAQMSHAAPNSTTNENTNNKNFPVFNKIPPAISGFAMTEKNSAYHLSVSVSSYGALELDGELVFELNRAGHDTNLMPELMIQKTATGYAVKVYKNLYRDEVIVTVPVTMTHETINSTTLYDGGPAVHVYNFQFAVNTRDLSITEGNYIHVSGRYAGKLMPIVGFDAKNTADTFGAQYTDFTNAYPNKEIEHKFKRPIQFYKHALSEGNSFLDYYYFISPTRSLTRIAVCPFADKTQNQNCLAKYESFNSDVTSKYLTTFPEANFAEAGCHDEKTSYWDYYVDCSSMRREAANEFNPYIAKQQSHFVSYNTIALDFDVMTFSTTDNVELRVGFFDELFKQVGDFVDIEKDAIVRKGSGNMLFSYLNRITDHRLNVRHSHTFANEDANRLFPYVYVVVYIRDKDAQQSLTYEGKDFSESYFFTQYGAIFPENLHEYASLVQIDSAISGGAARVTNDKIEDKLIAQYLFDGRSLNDTSGNLHHASMVGDVRFVADRHGNADSAIRFNGEREYITSNKSLFNDLQTFTLEGWVKPDSLKGNRTGLFGQNDAVELGLLTPSVVQAWSATHTGLNTPSTALAIGQWNHIAVVGSFGRFSIYINGKLKNSVVKQGGKFAGSNSAFNIGGAVFDASTSFNYMINSRTRHFEV